jgi:hypothetical protein
VDGGADAGRPRDAEVDGSAEIPFDAEVDSPGETPFDAAAAVDAHDVEPRDAAPDADPNVYPCGSERDCTRWWPVPVSCTDGYCCQGDVVDGQCICGVRVGTCPPQLYCCRSEESPDADVCTGRCYWPGF